MNERDVLLNELAQGLRPMSQGIEWFDSLGQEEQSEVLLFLPLGGCRGSVVEGHSVHGGGRAWSVNNWASAARRAA
ncbi:DUF5958 family protein [Streptomyces sp. NPDC059611]|uniref:DUF5958 family protein n=1 Tax=Streptomyces sp. NPDC059611 TaxID=3346884 RepID=UPI0036760CB6